MISVFSTTQCALGEGPLWHPERNQLFWFDILGKRLLTRIESDETVWQFDENVSAAGWVDKDTLLMASESGLFRLDLASGNREKVVALEADNAKTRSNDGRADPQGGFWIGTMGKASEPRAGAIYRFFKGELRKLYGDITVSNSICFSPDGGLAYWTDTWSRQIMRQPLDADGWPDGEAGVFVDLKADGLNPDGSVVDATGCLWNAQWGAHRVARYSPDGEFLSEINFPASQISCPAFGGPGLDRLYVTSAATGVQEAQGGMTFAVEAGAVGQAEHRVIL